MQPAVSATERVLAQDYSSALEFAQRATAVAPSFWIGHLRLAEAYERLGNSELALEALAKAEALSGNSKMLSLRGYILAKSGRTKQAEDLLRTLKSMERKRYVPPYAMALVYAGLGQRDLALSGSIAPMLRETCISSSCLILSGTLFARTLGCADSSNAATSCAP